MSKKAVHFYLLPPLSCQVDELVERVGGLGKEEEKLEFPGRINFPKK